MIDRRHGRGQSCSEQRQEAWWLSELTPRLGHRILLPEGAL